MSEQAQMILLLVALPATLAFGALAGAFALFRSRDAANPSTPRTIATVVLALLGSLCLLVALGTGACFGYVATLP